ncbi:MAG: hypothetical protein GX335_00065 [Firmicutes bacterium]|nr:hypothetical protein [Bacillota bacterium]
MGKERTGLLLALLIVICFCSQSAASTEYLLGVGDTLRISVWGHPELTVDVEVRPDGYITFPLVGDHWAIDKSSRQLSGELQEILANFVVNPQVTVIIQGFRTLQIQILGEVKSTGYYELKAGSRLLDVLALAGGPTPAADLSKISITRYFLGTLGPKEETQVFQVDANQFILSGSLDANPLVQDGDLIFVPASGQAIIFGEVRQPSSYDLGTGLDLLDLLALAEGALESADLERVVLTRRAEQGSVEKIINVQGLLEGRGSAVPLNPGDLVFVPPKQEVIVLGAVLEPGSYVLKKETTLVDILAQAGGVTPQGDSTQIIITRNSQGEEEILKVNAFPVLRGRKGGQNPLLAASDLIFVPEGHYQALVLGQVERPGSYPVGEQTRVLDLLAEAGGTKELAGEKINLTRAGETKEIDLGALERLGLQNEKILPGDILYVPEGLRQVLILGEVRSPGYYQFRFGDRVLEAVGLAGGFLESAALEQVSLRRQNESEVELRTIDFEQLLENRYSADNVYLQDGDVILVPKSRRSTLVLGEVRNPGYYLFTRGEKILDAVARAGGFTSDADLSQVLVRQETDSGLRASRVDLSYESDLDLNNVALKGGEIISVPKADRTVLVFGGVVRAGAYVLPAGGRVLDVLALAGGLESPSSWQDVIMTRQEPQGEKIWHLNYEELMTAQSEFNLPLLGGDVLYVPESRNQILVLGEVRSPGVFNLPLGARVMDAIALAGGPLERAALENVGIYRDGTIQDSEVVAMGKDKLLFTGDAEENPLLKRGDIIYVPETKKPNWTKIFSFIGGIKTFSDLLRGFIPR